MRNSRDVLIAAVHVSRHIDVIVADNGLLVHMLKPKRGLDIAITAIPVMN
jgi:hypothetical protein